MANENYKRFIETELSIIDKTGVESDFRLNKIQNQYLTGDSTGRDIILKARQQGFSSLVLAKKTARFLLKENSYIYVIADNADNAMGQLERVKYFLESYERKNDIKIPLKYNSKYELYNAYMNTRYIIGTAENTEVGRSKTITDLHLTEAAFFKDFRKLLASVLQGVVPSGEVTIETTANGFNEFKTFWDESSNGETGFAPLFYPASAFYPAEFLSMKKMELGRYYPQEYPESALEAFLTSGESYFDLQALKAYMERVSHAQML